MRYWVVLLRILKNILNLKLLITKMNWDNFGKYNGEENKENIK